jgi:CHASE2 domain-containing sensor protein
MLRQVWLAKYACLITTLFGFGVLWGVFRERLRAIHEHGAPRVTIIEALSYDLPFRLRWGARIEDMVIVEFTPRSYKLYDSDHDDQIDRSKIAEGLSRIRKLGPKLVFLDALLSVQKEEEGDDALAAELTQLGSVLVLVSSARSEGKKLHTRFLSEGITVASPDADDQPWRTVRRLPGLIIPFTDGGDATDSEATIRLQTSAAWAAAEKLGLPVTTNQASGTARWLNYLGPGRTTFSRLDFADLLATTNGLSEHKGRLFFVGDGVDDVSRNPVDGKLMPSIEVHATAVANLRGLSGGWLRELPVGWQGLAVLAWGVFAPLVLSWWHGLSGRLLVGSVAVSVFLASVIVQVSLQIWWTWFIPIVVQTAAAYGCAGFCRGGQVFISYRSTDGEQAAALIETALLARGRRPFLSPGNIEPGTDFAAELLRRIRRTRLLLLVLTPNAREALLDLDSWVHREVAHALTHRRRIVVIRVRTEPLSHAELPKDIGQIASLEHLVFDSGVGRRALLDTIGCL